MEDTLASLWNSLSLTDCETSNIVIDRSKLSTPANTIVGRLAMKRFVSLFEIEKGMRSFWEIKGAMETTRLGDNLFMFIFDDKQICNRIIEEPPWNFKGSLLMVEHVYGEECPVDFEPSLVPFWVQTHGLQIRAMNKDVGEMIEATIGQVLEVRCNQEGRAFGRCIRMRILLDIHKPLARWTNANIDGLLCRIFFKFEKLADFCFICGRLDHLDRDCKAMIPERGNS